MNDKRPIFIVSTGRSGSKMLAKTLALHPQLFSLHEPRPHLNPEAFLHWKSKNKSKNDEILRSIKQKRGSLISQTNGNQFIYIESSHYCSHLIPYLMELYNGKFIHLFRDGRDFVRSGLERKWYKEETFKNLSESIKKRILRLLRRSIKIDRSSWEDHRLLPPSEYSNRMEKITWLWVEINKVILESFTEYKPDYISVKLEEFNTTELERILNFIDVYSSESLLNEMVQLSNKKPNKTEERRIASFTEWDISKKESFKRIASDMMKTLGYTS